MPGRCVGFSTAREPVSQGEVVLLDTHAVDISIIYRTDAMITTLMAYTIQTGLLTW